MANLQVLTQEVNDGIYQNNEQAITGANLNRILRDMISTLGDGYRFKGVVTPSSAAISTDNKVFVLAIESGTYSNFGFTVPDGYIGVFSYDTSWHLNTVTIPVPIVNDLGTNDATKALSAAQGYLLGQLLGITDIEKLDAKVNVTGTTTTATPVPIVNGTKYRIYWSGATPDSSVLSVSFGTASTTTQTTALNLTTLTSANGYIDVVATVTATHLRVASRTPIVSEVRLTHSEQATGVLENLRKSLFNAFPATDLFWVNHSAMNSSTGAVASNTNSICSRTYLPVDKYCPDKVVRFTAFTDNMYNFAVSLYSAANESSHLGRIGFTTDNEISIDAYPSAKYIRISLVYKDPTNTVVLSAGIASEFQLENLYIVAQSKLQDVAIPANTSVRVDRKTREIRHIKMTNSISAGQGFCKYGNYWLVGLSSGTSFDTGSQNSSYINIYNESFQMVGRIRHNLGHFSCLSYCPEKDVFISSNGNADEYPRLDILLNASSHIQAALQSETSEYMYGASDVMSIPLHNASKDIAGDSDAGVWCFGGNDRYVYISVRDRASKIRRFYKGILGVGTADFSDSGSSNVLRWGTFVSGKTNNEFNGTLLIVDSYIGETIASAQGIDYYNGKLIISSSTDRININVVNLFDNTYQIVGYYSIANLAADGSEQNAEPEDLTVTENGIFINTTIGMFKIGI